MAAASRAAARRGGPLEGIGGTQHHRRPSRAAAHQRRSVVHRSAVDAQFRELVAVCMHDGMPGAEIARLLRAAGFQWLEDTP